MNQEEFEAWNLKYRRLAEEYLERQGIENPKVGPWAAFDMAPHFAIWCVESKKEEGRIGWWVFAGDCPTDYVTENGKCHPREALKDLLVRWKSCVPHMKEGKQPPDVRFGDGTNLEELGGLLEKRIILLEEWVADPDLWEDR